jgi:branched-chain amino acid transport system permease protein
MRVAELLVAGLTYGSIYAFIALGFHLVFKMTGLLDFAQGDKLVLGSLVALTLLRSGADVVVALLVVGVGGLAAGVVYERVVIRPTLETGQRPPLPPR